MAFANEMQEPAGAPFSGRLDGFATALYEYWQDIHPGGGLLPGRQHFDPAALAAQHPQLLQHLWLVDVQRDPLQFRLLLVGSAVRMTAPFAHSGQYIDEFIDPASRAETLRAVFSRVAESGQPEFRCSVPAPLNRGARTLSRLSLPLAGNGEAVDMILNITTSALSVVDKPDLPRLF